MVKLPLQLKWMCMRKLSMKIHWESRFYLLTLTIATLVTDLGLSRAISHRTGIFSYERSPNYCHPSHFLPLTPKVLKDMSLSAFLPLWLLTLLRYKLFQKGIAVSYNQIIRDLRSVHVTRVHIKSTNTTFLKLDKVPVLRMIKYITLLHLNAMLKEG